MGAYRADPGGNDDAGESYVVLGKADSVAVNLAKASDQRSLVSSPSSWLNQRIISPVAPTPIAKGDRRRGRLCKPEQASESA